MNEREKQKKLSWSHIHDMLINSPSKKILSLKTQGRVGKGVRRGQERMDGGAGEGEKRYDRGGYREKEVKNIYMYEGKGIK